MLESSGAAYTVWISDRCDINSLYRSLQFGFVSVVRNVMIMWWEPTINLRAGLM